MKLEPDGLGQKDEILSEITEEQKRMSCNDNSETDEDTYFIQSRTKCKK